MKKNIHSTSFTDRATIWIGSKASLVAHTTWFIISFGLVVFKIVDLKTMLLVLTTIVSLEAIYLNIFIQMTVNKNTESLREVEEDIEEIQEDVEELGEDMDEIQEDIEEITEDVEGMSKDVGEISKDVEEMTKDVEEISEDMGEIQKDIEELHEEDTQEEIQQVTGSKNKKATATIEEISLQLQKILVEVEALRKK
jgi:uncharacterized protein YoxC